MIANIDVKKISVFIRLLSNYNDYFRVYFPDLYTFLWKLSDRNLPPVAPYFLSFLLLSQFSNSVLNGSTYPLCLFFSMNFLTFYPWSVFILQSLDLRAEMT